LICTGGERNGYIRQAQGRREKSSSHGLERAKLEEIGKLSWGKWGPKGTKTTTTREDIEKKENLIGT